MFNNLMISVIHTSQLPACLIQTSSIISDYDLGGEGDLFKAPEPIIIEQHPSLIRGIDPMTSSSAAAAISMISCGEEDIITPQEMKLTTDIQSLQNEEFLNDVFYECKDILAKEAAAATATGTETVTLTESSPFSQVLGNETVTITESSPFSQVLGFSFPVVSTEENLVVKENDDDPSCQIPKSMSCDSLNSMDWAQVKPSVVNFSEIDFGNAYGMRRAFSEGDIKTLGDANSSFIHYPVGQPPLISERITEDRLQKLSRYRNKKAKRNFGRKIKYACRKALADSQPRIRGRFARTDESPPTHIFRK
ncbi:uncharacterized protein [Rutidosis leptorrhynchoides]|uniref:uncharacterized protein isoform X2 n=1 Tax=Rutidosis leptorrhynchoides TaxID=125765 RepID=UPI003A9A1CBA